MDIRVINTFKDLLKLESSWKNIFNKIDSTNIFTSWEWSSLWIKHFCKDNDLLILVIEENEVVVGVAPLMVVRGNIFSFYKPIVCFIGGALADYSDFLVLQDNRKVVRIILDFLVKEIKWGMIVFDRIPQSSPNLMYLKEFLPELSYSSQVNVRSVSPCIRIENGWEGYYKKISKGLKQDIRTANNKLKLVGELTYEVYDERASKMLLDAFFQMHKKRQSSKVGKSIYECESNRKFFNELASVFNDLGWMDFSILKAGGRVISSVFAFKYKKVFFYWIPVFDPEFLKYSPAKVHIQMLIKKCFDMDFKEFDLMRGDEDYKFKWADSSLSNYEIKIYSIGILCELDLIKNMVRRLIKDMYKNSPFFRKILIMVSKLK